MTLRCLAAAPTTTPPLGWNETTDGWTLPPASSAKTFTAPVASACATTELDVPRSMPTIGSVTLFPLPGQAHAAPQIPYPAVGKLANTSSYQRSIDARN